MKESFLSRTTLSFSTNLGTNHPSFWPAKVFCLLLTRKIASQKYCLSLGNGNSQLFKLRGIFFQKNSLRIVWPIQTILTKSIPVKDQIVLKSDYGSEGIFKKNKGTILTKICTKLLFLVEPKVCSKNFKGS